MYRAESGRRIIAGIAVFLVVALVVALLDRRWLGVAGAAGTLFIALMQLWGPRRTPTSSR